MSTGKDLIQDISWAGRISLPGQGNRSKSYKSQVEEGGRHSAKASQGKNSGPSRPSETGQWTLNTHCRTKRHLNRTRPGAPAMTTFEKGALCGLSVQG